jgi:hypothetical protein
LSTFSLVDNIKDEFEIVDGVLASFANSPSHVYGDLRFTMELGSEPQRYFWRSRSELRIAQGSPCTSEDVRRKTIPTMSSVVALRFVEGVWCGVGATWLTSSCSSHKPDSFLSLKLFLSFSSWPPHLSPYPPSTSVYSLILSNEPTRLDTHVLVQEKEVPSFDIPAILHDLGVEQ